MNLTIENVFFIITLGSFILFIGAWYGSTKKKLSEIETDLKEVKNDKYEIIDKLARIETKLDYLTKQ
jgi:hypothetical protein